MSRSSSGILRPAALVLLGLAGAVAVIVPVASDAQGDGAVRIWGAKLPPGTAPFVSRNWSFADLKLEEGDRFDAQYGKAYRFRGVPLARLLGDVPAGYDLALLRFENGMVIPLPFRDAAAMARLDPFLARAMVIAEEADDRPTWHPHFPPIYKKGAEAVDRRPITFTGNKLVVKERWHPLVSEKAAATFSPWAVCDSLVGIELVRAESWWRQFDAGKNTAAGQAVFQHRCAFCHGARHLGAGFGWDFVEPVPLHGWRDAKSLQLHVRYRETDAPQRGLMMPVQADMSDAEGRALWGWLEAIAAATPKDYAP